MVKNLVIKDNELKELIGNIHKNNQIRSFVFISFLILSFVLKWLDAPMPYSVIAIIFSLFLLNIFCEYLVKRIWPGQTVNQVSISYFILQVLEVVAVLIAISKLEGVLYGGITVLLIYVVFCYLGFTRIIYPRLLTLFCLIGYIIAGLVKYFKIIPYTDLQGLGINPYENSNLVLLVMSFMVGSFICVSFYVDVFSRKFLDTIHLIGARTLQLKTRENDLQSAKASLEVRVEARTRELRELSETLNEQVQQRTKELQEKIKALEKFQRLSVGRELKMVELKKEIKKLKNF